MSEETLITKAPFAAGWHIRLKRVQERADRIRRQIQAHWQAIVSAESAPGTVALSFAAGTFISLVPMPFADVAVAMVLARVCRRLQRLPLFTAMTVWNNAVTAPLYATSYRLGVHLNSYWPAGDRPPVEAQSLSWARDFLLGNLALALVLSALCYGIIYLALKSRQKHLAKVGAGQI